MAQLGDVRVREDGNGEFHVERYVPHVLTKGAYWAEETTIFKSEDAAIYEARRLKAEQIRKTNSRVTKRVFYI